MDPSVISQLVESLHKGNNFLNGITKVTEELEKDLSIQKREKSIAVNLFFSEILKQNNFIWFNCCLIVYCAIHESIDTEESIKISLNLGDKLKYFMDSEPQSSLVNMVNILDVKWYKKFQIESDIIFRILAKLCFILKIIYLPTAGSVDPTTQNGQILIMIQKILESLFNHFPGNTRRLLFGNFVDKNKLDPQLKIDVQLRKLISLNCMNSYLFSVINGISRQHEEVSTVHQGKI